MASLGYWDHFFSRHSRSMVRYYSKLMTPLEVKNSMEMVLLFNKKEYGGLVVNMKLSMEAVTRLCCGN